MTCSTLGRQHYGLSAAKIWFKSHLGRSPRKSDLVSWKHQLGFLEQQVRARFVSAAIELQKDRWSGRLYLIDVPRTCTTESGLRFLAELVRQVVPAVHNVALLQELRSHAAALERKRIAAELHDGIVPSVATLEMGLHVLGLHQNGGGNAKLVQDLQKVAHKMVFDVRQLIHGLYPVDFATGDLVSNLAAMVTKFQQTGVNAQFLPEVRAPKLPPGEKTRLGGSCRKPCSMRANTGRPKTSWSGSRTTSVDICWLWKTTAKDLSGWNPVRH